MTTSNTLERLKLFLSLKTISHARFERKRALGNGAMLNSQQDYSTCSEQKITFTPLYCFYKKGYNPVFYSRPIKQFDYITIAAPYLTSGHLRSNNSKRKFEIIGDVITITVSGRYNYQLVGRITAITAMPPRRQKTA